MNPIRTPVDYHRVFVRMWHGRPVILGNAIDSNPGVELEIERLVPTAAAAISLRGFQLYYLPPMDVEPVCHPLKAVIPAMTTK